MLTADDRQDNLSPRLAGYTCAKGLHLAIDLIWRNMQRAKMMP
jgi:hypothetical protein